MNLYTIGLPGGAEIFFILIIIFIIFWVVALFDCLKSDKPIESKIIWVVLIMVLPVVGSIIYWLAGRDGKKS